jgi:hypothetical protein
MFGTRAPCRCCDVADDGQTVGDAPPWSLAGTGERRTSCVELQPRDRDPHGLAYDNNGHSSVILTNEQVIELA